MSTYKKPLLVFAAVVVFLMAGYGIYKFRKSSTVAIGELTKGQCIASLPAESENSPGRVKKADCDSSDILEVFAVDIEGFPINSQYPEPEAAETKTRAYCERQFAESFSQLYEESDLQMKIYYPTESNWDKGARQIICFATKDVETAV